MMIRDNLILFIYLFIFGLVRKQVFKFSRRPPPRKFKLPQLPVYSGTGDPIQHVQQFESLVLLHGWDDVTACHVFTLTLVDYAYNQFYKLPEGSVSLYDQLRREFLMAFSINASQAKNPIYLLCVCQEPCEPLRRYIDRFRNAILEVHDAPAGIGEVRQITWTKSWFFGILIFWFSGILVFQHSHVLIADVGSTQTT